MLERGFIPRATQRLKRAWPIYFARMLLLAIYLAQIGDLAQKSGSAEFANECNIAGFIRTPATGIYEG